ncbi:uncharacterized protein [Watersipora subatra]|uniref:uncharacterized protein n=1 Tax=Watersipora subatra TaxID=2589382 RepID=UPI00355B4A22
MAIKILVVLLLLHVSLTHSTDLTAANSLSRRNNITLSNSGTLDIKSGSTSNSWSLSFPRDSTLQIKSRRLCLDCADKLTLSDTGGQVSWDVATFHELNGGAQGEKACNLTTLYCTLTAHSPAVVFSKTPALLKFERLGTKNLDITFEYDIYPNPTTTKPLTVMNLPTKFQQTSPSKSTILSFCYSLLAAPLLVLFYI